MQQALGFDMLMRINNTKFDMQDFKLDMQIGGVQIYDEFLLYSNIGKIMRTHFGQVFESLFNMFINNINVQYGQFDITKLDKTLALVAGQFPNITASPAIATDYFYLGIKFFTD